MTRRLRRRFGRARKYLGPLIPWQGIDYIERRYHEIQPKIALAVLGDRDYRGPAERLHALDKAEEFLSWLLSQERGPTAHARRFMDQKIREMRRLLAKAGV